ncbi:MAG TPA: hypothetical protein VGO35_04230 [Gammaproteobacteria bacterium]|jgi:hypothetical protein|nr:hypothetical protein [Gammaproteobacteria bacterium]
MNKQNNVQIGPGIDGYAAFPKGAGPFPGVLVFMDEPRERRATGQDGLAGHCTRDGSVLQGVKHE